MFKLGNDNASSVFEVIKGEETPIEKWSHFDTLALIESYRIHQQTFQDLKFTQAVWELIHQDLLKQGIYKSSFHIANKWKNLVRTYKNVKQTNREGKKIRFQYMSAMKSVMENEVDTRREHEDTQLECDNDPVTLEFSMDNLDDIRDLIEYSVEDNSSKNGDNTLDHNTMVALKTKYLKQKILEIENRRKERLKYLEIISDAKRVKRQLRERKLELKEKELEVEERKVRALEQLLALKRN